MHLPFSLLCTSLIHMPVNIAKNSKDPVLRVATDKPRIKPIRSGYFFSTKSRKAATVNRKKSASVYSSDVKSASGDTAATASTVDTFAPPLSLSNIFLSRYKAVMNAI